MQIFEHEHDRVDVAEGAQEVPGSTLFGRRDEPGRALRLRVAGVRAAGELGEFALRPSQDAARVLFVPLATLQRAFAREGRAAALDRVAAYVEAGADMIFAEALYTLDDYAAFTRAIEVPVLANLTEFGLTPYFTVTELRRAGVKIALYPLSAFRAMSRAALRVYETIRREGTQRSMLDAMQTRDELYAVLDYLKYERKLDELNAKSAATGKRTARKRTSRRGNKGGVRSRRGSA